MTPVLYCILSGGLDPDAQLYADAVRTNGGQFSIPRLRIVSKFFRSEKNSGGYQNSDDYAGFWAENSIQALTTLKQRRLAVAVNTPTFTADRNYATNGTTSYINLIFVPSTDALSMSTNSTHIEIYERTSTSGSSTAIGAGSSSSRNISVTPRNGVVFFGSGSSANGTFTLSPVDSRGLTQIGRNGPLTTNLYGAKNGVDATPTITPSAVGASLPAHNLLVGAFNNVGTPIAFRAGSYGYAAYGAALSATQRLARYANVQAWATSVGANV